MTRTAAVVSILLAACTSSVRLASVPPGVADSLREFKSECLVADTTAPARDTVFVIGMQSPDAGRPFEDCEHHAIPVTTGPVVVMLTPPTTVDLRDVLDGTSEAGGIRRPDVMVTRDPDVQEYAARGVGYLTKALPWTDTYAVISLGPESSPSTTAVERDALARDAVRADVRGAAEPFAWKADAACVSTVMAPPSTRPVVGYPIGDNIARELASRIVSLAGGSAHPAWLPAAVMRVPTALRVAPFETDSLASALASGRAVAAVGSFTREHRAPCGVRVVPLVDARAHVIVRRGSGAAFTIGADGTLRFTRRGAP